MSNEAFEKWFQEQYPYDDITAWEKQLSLAGWQAAKADSEREIAMLKVRVGDVTQAYQEKVNELQAHINDLREALEENHYCNSSEKAINLYNAAISKPPAQSLQEHANEVIEKCAKVCDGYTHGAWFADKIRTLKG